jgi:hypothetical protein
MESVIGFFILLGVLALGLGILAIPFWLLSLVFRGSVVARKDDLEHHSADRKGDVVRALWEWDRLWRRK